MDEFLARVAFLIGLPRDGALALRNLETMRGPAGLLCRLRIGADERVPAVRPEVLLPIAAATLGGARAERLLALQQAMMLELRWVIGLSSDGRLQLSTADWLHEPAAAVEALDVGQLLGLRALRELDVDAG